MRLLKRLYYLLFFKESDLIRQVKSMTGIIPGNPGIYKTAFLHKSLLNETDEDLQSNERLEYLGDAILNSIVAEFLFKKYPDRDEGFLTKMRSKIVKRRTLNSISENMGLDLLLKEYNNTRLSLSMMGNALEALVGAVYLDRGYRRTKVFVIKRILTSYLDLEDLEARDDNYKSRLLEHCQSKGYSLEYRVLEKFKTRNRDKFKVQVLIDGKAMAMGEGYNKKSAEQKASARALENLPLI